MAKKDFSAILNLLKTNGVGMVELFFQSNMDYYVLRDKNKPQQKWKVDFSDGTEYLGSLEISGGQIDNATKELQIQITSLKHADFTELLSIHFSFNSFGKRGKCSIEFLDK